MKRITLGALALLLSLQVAAAAPFTIAKPWTTVRARPSADAPAIALAFGNDALPVVKRSGEWVAVRLSKGRLGWVPAADGAQAPAVAAPAPPQMPGFSALDAPPLTAATPLLLTRGDPMAPGGT